MSKKRDVRLVGWLATAALGLALSGPVHADNLALIQDIEGLRNSLPLDDPSRQTLTLRLADLYFDRSSDLSSRGGATFTEIDKSRKRSLSLYREALQGTKFTPAVTGDLAYKVKFQMARLYQDMHQTEKANPIWLELVKQEHLPQLRREAALRLAEYYDEKGQYGPAADHYQLGLDLCSGGDTCSYIHYRRAWLLRNLGKLDDGIEEMKKALYDSKGQVREEALRDLIVFLAANPSTDGQSELLYIEDLAKKLQRPNLIPDLSEAFFSAGNRAGGTTVLAYMNSRKPNLDAQVRLLEEYYGSRQWETFRDLLDQILAAPAPGSQDEKEMVNREKILRRLTVQLDGERASNKELTRDFQNVVELYLTLFPNNENTYKMMEGWLAVEDDPMVRVERIAAWTEGPKFPLKEAQKQKLLTMRKAILIKKYRDEAAEGQKKNEHDQVIAAVDQLFGLEDKKTHRELTYIKARALYAQKKLDTALPLFLDLASTNEAKPDKWAIQSQHLALDVYSQQKKYDALIRQAEAWVNHPVLAKTAKHDAAFAKELADMGKVLKEATFERAVAAGETPQALEFFTGFCMADQFLPKSCENARVLAVKLAQEATLLKLLNKMGKKEELLVEYEAAGFFDKAAPLYEELRLKKETDEKNFLKTALLYELGNQLIERNRVLVEFTRYLSRKKELGEMEPLVYQTLKDAGMLYTAQSFALPWAPETKAEIANQLELTGKGNRETRQVLLTAERSPGKAWAALILEKLETLDKRQRQVRFYGRNSQQRFERRLRLLKELATTADEYLPKAQTPTRVEIALLVKKAHDDLAREILDTPIPKELDEEGRAEVQTALTTMAQPFQEKGTAYGALAKEQLAKVADLAERAGLQAKLEDAGVGLSEEEKAQLADAQGETAPSAPVSDAESASRTAELVGGDVKRWLERLHDNPNDRSALEGAKQFYEQAGNKRLSAYFEGRLLQLTDEANKGDES